MSIDQTQIDHLRLPSEDDKYLRGGYLILTSHKHLGFIYSNLYQIVSLDTPQAMISLILQATKKLTLVFG
jgi:hypothetical protein